MKQRISHNQIEHELKSAFSEIDQPAIVMHTDLFRIRFAERGVPIQQQLENLLSMIKNAAAGRPLLFPTFNYDFCRNGVYDVNNDPCQVGTFNEFIRQQNSGERTHTPVFNFYIINNNGFSCEPALNPFAANSTFAEMVKKRAEITFLGATFAANTFIHHVEEVMNIGYRYIKKFTGIIRCQTEEKNIKFEFRVRPTHEGAVDYDWLRLEKDLEENAMLRKYPVAGGYLLSFSAPRLLEYWQEKLRTDELYLLTPSSRQKILELYNEYGKPLCFEKVEL